MPSVCGHVDGTESGADGVVLTGHKRGGSADLVAARHGGGSSRNSCDVLSATHSNEAEISYSVRYMASSDCNTELATSENQEAQNVRCDGSSSCSRNRKVPQKIVMEERADKEGSVVVAAASVQPKLCLSERASAFSIAALLQTKQRHSLTRIAAADDGKDITYAPPRRTKRTCIRNSTENDSDHTSGIEISGSRMRLNGSSSDIVTMDTGTVPVAIAGAAALAPSHPESSLHRLSDGCRSDGVIICRSSVVNADAAVADAGPELKKSGCGHDGEETAAVVCQLESKELWNRFHGLGTEMIITKSGRRMFPVLSVSFSGLVPDESYLVATDMLPVDNKRYRYTYHRSAWLVAGRADPKPTTSGLHVHPDCPMTGRQLNRHAISFERIKLTNSTSSNTLNNKSGHIVLASMHKYQPRIHLIRRSAALALSVAEDKASSSSGLLLLQNLSEEHYRTFTFPETEFIAVTAYQNQMITKLKIDSNPFAKGFRDSTRLTELDREEYPCSVGELDEFKDLLPAPFPNPLALFPGALSSSSSSHNPLSMQRMLQDVGSKTHQDNPTRTSAFNHVHTSFSSSSIADTTSFDFPSMPSSSSSVSKPTAINSLRCSPKVLEQKSLFWQSAHDQQSCDQNTLDCRLPVSDTETRQQMEVYRMISLLPRPSISQFSPRTDLALSPVVMAAANSFYALRYHPYPAAPSVTNLYSNSLQS